MLATDHLGHRLPLVKAAWWVIRRPIFTVLFATVLFVQGATQPRETWVGSLFAAGRTCCYCGSVGRFLIIEKDGVVSLSADMRSSDAEHAIGDVFYRPRTETRGIWAPTSRAFVHRPRISIDDDDPAGTKQKQVMQLLATELATYEGGMWAAYAPLIAAGGGETVTPIAGGYLQNLAALALAAGLVLSLRWVPKLTMAQVEMNRRNEGLCGKCAYDLRGLASERCPECGYEPVSSEPVAW